MISVCNSSFCVVQTLCLGRTSLGGLNLRSLLSVPLDTASIPLQYPNGSFYYPPGGSPKDIHWIGLGNQARAAIDAGVEHILYVSSTGTTRPGGFFDKLANGWATFYRLNGEADLMASGIPFTIVKPGPLLDTPGEINSQCAISFVSHPLRSTVFRARTCLYAYFD